MLIILLYHFLQITILCILAFSVSYKTHVCDRYIWCFDWDLSRSLICMVVDELVSCTMVVINIVGREGSHAQIYIIMHRMQEGFKAGNKIC